MKKKARKGTEVPKKFPIKTDRLVVIGTLGCFAIMGKFTGHDWLVTGCLFGGAVYALNVITDWMTGGKK